jgi:hypothetical protein
VPPGTPVAGPVPPATKLDKLDYYRTFSYFFENPQWTTTLLWGFLVLLVGAMVPGVGPLLGMMLMLGYSFEVVDALLHSQGTRFPIFDINRFGDYFLRGAWPLLAALVAMLVLVPICMLLLAVVVFVPLLIAGVAGEDAAPIVGIIMMILMVGMMLVVIALSIVLHILMVPLMLRAGLAQDFVEAFKFEWIKDFARKMWVETLLGALFVGLAGFVLTLVGLLACCVGAYAAQTVVLMAYAHLLYQLYAIYLTRGGAPVYPKPKLAPPL